MGDKEMSSTRYPPLVYSVRYVVARLPCTVAYHIPPLPQNWNLKETKPKLEKK
jgi:hypothetical protein